MLWLNDFMLCITYSAGRKMSVFCAWKEHPLFCHGSEVTVYMCFRHAVMRKMLRMMTSMMQVSSLAIPHYLVGRTKILYNPRGY